MPALILRYAPQLIIAALVAAALFGAYRHGVTVTTTAWKLDVATQKAKADAKILEAQDAVMEAERRGAASVAIIEGRLYEQEQEAAAIQARLRDDLRTGAVRLRDRFTCPASAGGVPGTASDSGGAVGIASGGLRADDAEFLISEARRADTVARELQACKDTLVAWRELVNGSR